MAVIPFTRVAKPSGQAQFDRIQLFKWEGMTTGDVGQPVFSCNHSDRTFTVYGALNGATVTAQGYNAEPLDETKMGDDNFWLPLVDQSDNNISFLTKKHDSVAPLTIAIRPAVTGGTATLVDVYLIVKE